MKCALVARALAATALLALALGLGGVAGVGHFLEAPAQQPVPADLIAALGGDNGARAARVLDLYRGGFATKVLLTGPEGGHSRTRPSYLGWRARYLVDQGLPEQALLYDHRSASTWEEAINTLRLMQEMNLDRVLVVSDPPHMRRLAWVWSKVFAGSGKQFTLVASDMEGWDAAGWWRSSGNAQYVFGESIKLAYYVAAK